MTIVIAAGGTGGHLYPAVALAREFLNDWEAVWIVLAHPYLPLTNNEAGRALRHWVIARLLSQGTRTEQGSRAFALLASVIATCHRRHPLVAAAHRRLQTVCLSSGRLSHRPRCATGRARSR